MKGSGGTGLRNAGNKLLGESSSLMSASLQNITSEQSPPQVKKTSGKNHESDPTFPLGSGSQTHRMYSTQQVSDLLKQESKEKEKLLAANYQLQKKQALEHFKYIEASNKDQVPNTARTTHQVQRKTKDDKSQILSSASPKKKDNGKRLKQLLSNHDETIAAAYVTNDLAS